MRRTETIRFSPGIFLNSSKMMSTIRETSVIRHHYLSNKKSEILIFFLMVHSTRQNNAIIHLFPYTASQNWYPHCFSIHRLRHEFSTSSTSFSMYFLFQWFFIYCHLNSIHFSWLNKKVMNSFINLLLLKTSLVEPMLNNF